jgi:hypothetical protein
VADPWRIGRRHVDDAVIEAEFSAANGKSGTPATCDVCDKGL